MSDLSRSADEMLDMLITQSGIAGSSVRPLALHVAHTNAPAT